MEKLQAALKQAREQRAQNGGQPVQSGRAESGAPPSSAGDAWREMTAFIPDPAHLKANKVVSLKPQRDFRSFDILLTKVLLAMEKEGWKRLAITSPTTGCGKTTVVANFAAGLVRRTDKRVIVFEMDMRKPALARVLGIEPEDGVASILDGRLRLQDQAVRLSSNVALAVNKKPERDPSALFMRDQTASTLSDVEKQYQPDIVIFDMPPVLVTDDAMAFFKNVDCALLVVGAGKSSIEEVDRAEQEVSQYTNMVGTVLNQCEFAEEGYGYGYGDEVGD